MIRVQIDGTTHQHLNTVEISGEKNKEVGAFFYDLKCNELKFGKEVYDILVALPVCEKLPVEVQQDCNDGNGYVTIFSGYTSKLRCKFEPKKCIVTVKIVANNLSDCFLRTWEEEHNILQTIQPITTEFSGVGSIEGFYGTTALLPADWSANSGATRLKIPVGGIVGELFARQVAVTYSTEGTAQAPQIDNTHNATGWYLLEDRTAIDGTSTWTAAVTQPVYDILISNSNIEVEVCSPSPCTPPVPTTPGTWERISTQVGLGGGSVTFSLFVNVDPLKEFIPNGRLLSGTMNYLTSQNACGITYYSSYFGSATNPISGHSPNPLVDLVLYQKSDVVDPTATEKATIARTSLKELVPSICTLFNAYWYIGKTPSNLDALIIEHKSTLQSAQTVSIDLTTLDGGKYVANKEAFLFKEESIPFQEVPEFSIKPLQIDFVGLPIQYDSECKGSDDLVQSVTAFETEVARMVDSTNESTDGLVLLNRYDCLALAQQSYSTSPITGKWSPNITNSWSFCHEHYHKTADRALPQGIMNGNSETFTNTKRIKVEENVVFPVCCFDSFDATGLIRTNVGDGEIDSFTYNTKTKTIQCKLNHEI